MKYTALFLILFSSLITYAQSKNQIDQQALQQTQELMKNPTERNKAISQDPNAQGTDKMVKDLMGANSEEMYKAAADFMPYVVEKGKGDPNKMNEFIQQALRDPAAFEKDLPSDLKEKISSLAKKAKPLPQAGDNKVKTP
ncbi:MAG: hypothetical protein H7256_08780 [Bdellovibrio sp.]|nr:hypothetical protein [Bdellovibrio sp.]